MWGRLGPRFALEAAFLILLAVGLGLADQDWVVIIAVMGGGWVLVSLIELFASRRAAWVVPVERAPASAPPSPAPPPPAGRAPIEPEPISAPAPPPPVAEDTEEVEVGEPAAAEREAPREAEPVAAGEPHAEVRPDAELREPPEGEPEAEVDREPPRERRRWWLFGRRPKEEVAQEELIEPEVEVPKHVRRLTPDEASERTPAGATEEDH
jgi:hypothetical protein